MSTYQRVVQARALQDRVLSHNGVAELAPLGPRAALQRDVGSDAPSAHSDELFRRVREEIGEQAGSRGYLESNAEVVEVKDPVDDARVLDVWHEVTYRKSLQAVDDAVTEVRWALDLEKYVRP